MTNEQKKRYDLHFLFLEIDDMPLNDRLSIKHTIVNELFPTIDDDDLIKKISMQVANIIVTGMKRDFGIKVATPKTYKIQSKTLVNGINNTKKRNLIDVLNHCASIYPLELYSDRIIAISQWIASYTLHKIYTKTGNDLMRRYNNALYYDIHTDKSYILNNNLSDGYDIVQSVACFLCKACEQMFWQYGYVDIEHIFYQKKRNKIVKNSILCECFHIARKCISKNRQINNPNKFLYLSAIDNPDKHIKCLTSLQFGNGYVFTDPYAFTLYDDFMNNAGLSTLQKQCLRLLFMQFGYNQIAKKIGKSENTVKSAVRVIREKAVKYGFTIETIKTACELNDNDIKALME